MSKPLHEKIIEETEEKRRQEILEKYHACQLELSEVTREKNEILSLLDVAVEALLKVQNAMLKTSSLQGKYIVTRICGTCGYKEFVDSATVKDVKPCPECDDIMESSIGRTKTTESIPASRREQVINMAREMVQRKEENPSCQVGLSRRSTWDVLRLAAESPIQKEDEENGR